jgi:hypothetical protein
MMTLPSLRSLPLALLLVLPTVGGCQRASSEPDPSNELPFGFIDAPPNGASVDHQIQLYGWALDDDGVTDIRFFVDGRFAKRVGLDQARPDLTTPYASYTKGTDVHGWAVTLSLGPEVAAGNHSIVAQAVDTKGATHDIGAITVSVAK